MIHSFFREISAQGDLTCCFGLTIDGESHTPENVRCVRNGSGLHLTLSYENELKEEIFLSPLDDHSCTLQRRVCNNSGSTLHLNELFCRFSAITFGGEASGDYFYHTENPRLYSRYCLGVDEDHFQLCRDSGYDPEAGNRWSDPGTIHKRVGRSPYQPFPAFLLSNRETETGLLYGTLSQDVFYHCYECDHTPDGKIDLTLFSAFKSIDYRELQSGEILTDEWYFGRTKHSSDLQKIFEEYTSVLRKKLPDTYGKSSSNRHSVVWGSWNDGVCWDISEEELLKTAQYLKENFPTVEYLQVDAGYAAGSDTFHYFHGLGSAYEGEEGIDREKFPEGMASFFKKVRQIGLRPALWIGSFCPKRTRIYQEHPEWFVNYDFRVKGTAPLDVSKKEVRSYMEQALDILLTSFGADGMKQDFWSYAFEEGNPILANHEKSGYEYRSWWLQNIRKRLPQDGYLQVACDIGMNNPFMGEYINNFRYGIDIAHGIWENMKITYLWGSACFATHTGDLIIPNSDAVGLFPALSDDEALFCINYCLTTGSMVEVAGYLHKNQDHPRMKYLRKALCCPNNGQEIFLAGADYRNEKWPDKFFFKGPFFSLLRGMENLPLRTIGCFNLEDEKQTVEATLNDLDLPEGEYLAWDVWNNRSQVFDRSFSQVLPPHGSALFTIVPVNDEKQILDVDLKVSHIRKTPGNGVELTFAFAGNAKIFYLDENEIRVKEFVSRYPGDKLLIS